MVSDCVFKREGAMVFPTENLEELVSVLEKVTRANLDLSSITYGMQG